MNLNRMFTLFKNWKVVILSFLGAATFWFFNALNKDYQDRINYPIAFVYNKDSVVVITPLPEHVHLDVSGGGWDFFKKSTSFSVSPIQVPLKNPSETKYITRSKLLPIITNQLNRFKVNFLFSDTLFIDIDKKVKKTVNLRVDSLNIDLEENYRIVTPITVEPTEAVIYGPTRFIDTLSSTFTVAITEEDIDRSFDRRVKPGLPDAYEISSIPVTTRVRFGVEKFDNLNIPVHLELLNFPGDSSAYIENPETTIKFMMRRSIKEEYFSEDFKVIVDYDMVDPTDSTAPAMIVFYPKNAIEVEMEPDTFKIRYIEHP